MSIQIYHMIQVRRPDIAVKDKESDNAWLINTAVPRHEKVKNKTQWQWPSEKTKETLEDICESCPRCGWRIGSTTDPRGDADQARVEKEEKSNGAISCINEVRVTRIFQVCCFYSRPLATLNQQTTLINDDKINNTNIGKIVIITTIILFERYPSKHYIS